MIIPMLPTLLQSREKNMKHFPSSYYQSSITLVLKPRKKPKGGRDEKWHDHPIDNYRLKNLQLKPNQPILALNQTPRFYGQAGFIPRMQEWFNIRKAINIAILKCVRLNPKSV